MRQEAETSLGLDFYAWAEASAGEAALIEGKLGKDGDRNGVGGGDNADDDEDGGGQSRSGSKRPSTQGSKGGKHSDQKQAELRARAQTLRNDALAYFQVPLPFLFASSTCPTYRNNTFAPKEQREVYVECDRNGF